MAFSAAGGRFPVRMTLGPPHEAGDGTWACLVRCSPWMEKARPIFGDSAFSALATAIALPRMLLEHHIGDGGTVEAFDPDAEEARSGWREALDATFGGLFCRDAWEVHRLFFLSGARITEAAWSDRVLSVGFEGYVLQHESGPGFARNTGWSAPVTLTLTDCPEPPRLPTPGALVPERPDGSDVCMPVPLLRDETKPFALRWGESALLEVPCARLELAIAGEPRFVEEPGRQPRYPESGA